MTDLDTKRAAIASRLRLARELAGVSQAQVAQMLNIPRPSISQIEAGNRKVSAEELVAIAKLYDVSASWLAGSEPDEPDPGSAQAELAARELSKLKPEDVKRLITLLGALRRDRDPSK